MQKIAIIGGGILGLAIAYKLSISKSNYRITVFEKEKSIGLHQSGNNSGVLHCGLYYKPGSLKAKLAIEGIREMVSFCTENKVDHEICGKVVLATNEREINLLDDLAARGKLNGLSGLKFLNSAELKAREPFVKAKKALLVPDEGIVSYKQVMDTMASFIKNEGGEIMLDNKVMGISKFNSSLTELKTERFSDAYDLIINCTGLFSDRTFAKMTNQNSPIKILPFRGEYMHIANEYRSLVNHLIYPVPDPKYPFLGVHFTRMINGGREVGPNAVLALKREGYTKSDFSLSDTLETLTYKGFLNFLSKNFSFSLGEFISSLSRKAFVEKAKKLIPDIEDYMFTTGGTSGVRAQAVSKEGELLMDFNIVKIEKQIHVLNAPSPGATASLSIAEYIINKYVN